MTRITALQDDDPYADRRAAPRVPVALPASLQVGRDRHSVQIIDLSSGGAKVQCATDLPAGTAVVLDCGSLRCAAIVRWHTGGLLGLCFKDELDPREVSALMARSTALAALMKTRG